MTAPSSPTTVLAPTIENFRRSVVLLRDGALSATGFLVAHNEVAWLVSNKHVFDNLQHVSFDIVCDGVGAVDDNRREIKRNGVRFQWLAEEFDCVDHPDPKVDLACMPLLLGQWSAKWEGKWSVFPRLPPLAPVTLELFCEQTQLRLCLAGMDIYMAGFPKGLTNKAVRLPYVRKGIAASHPMENLTTAKSSDVAVVDIACFPGSSGSLLLAEFGHLTGSVTLGSPLNYFAIGVLASAPTYTTADEESIPLANETPTASADAATESSTATDVVPPAHAVVTHVLDQMMHIGYYVKSYRVRELIAVAERQFGDEVRRLRAQEIDRQQAEELAAAAHLEQQRTAAATTTVPASSSTDASGTNQWPVPTSDDEEDEEKDMNHDRKKRSTGKAKLNTHQEGRARLAADARRSEALRMQRKGRWKGKPLGDILRANKKT